LQEGGKQQQQRNNPHQSTSVHGHNHQANARSTSHSRGGDGGGVGYKAIASCCNASVTHQSATTASCNLHPPRHSGCSAPACRPAEAQPLILIVLVLSAHGTCAAATLACIWLKPRPGEQV
jgi:hypothetical protein